MLENRAEIRESERSIPRRCQFSNCIGLPKLQKHVVCFLRIRFSQQKARKIFPFWSLLGFRSLAEEECKKHIFSFARSQGKRPLPKLCLV